ncbi:MAG: hypothetical protein RIQ81_1573 [Pseudomonadota bacterium]|jgi:acyl-coenzyme A thioesterase PaaI-like protein
MQFTIPPWKATMFIRAFGLFKVPLIWYVRPKVLELNEERVVVKIPLRWRTKNHLNSMYFGTLAIGADIAGGMLAIMMVRQAGKDVSFVFKDIKGEFLKRPEADTLFTCTDGPAIRTLVDRAINSPERQNETVNIVATCPEKSGDEPVARFQLTLSLKRK